MTKFHEFKLHTLRYNQKISIHYFQFIHLIKGKLNFHALQSTHKLANIQNQEIFD